MRVRDIATARLAGMELLLLSNSTNYGESMYAHAAAAFATVTDGRTVTFVPYALADWDDYADRAIEEHGDYAKVAFLSYASLDLTVYCDHSPLLPLVREDAARMQARLQYFWSSLIWRRFNCLLQ